MVTASAQASSRCRRAGALLLGTQLGVVAASIITAFGFSLLAAPNAGAGGAMLSGIMLFTYYFAAGFAAANLFVLFFGLPVYVLWKRSFGRLAGTAIGAVCGIGTFVVLIFAVVVFSGGNLVENISSFWQEFLPMSLWIWLIIPALYGALVGLFTAELESKRSHVA